MRRFLVALLIAVAAGTDHFADPVAANPNPVAANPNPDPVADGACEGWCNQYTCESAACETCDICQTVFEGNFCASWCNDYTCGGTTTPPVELCGGCEACQFLFIGDGTRCLPWCNSYTCGQDDCAACNGMIGSPNCLDQGTFCEGWCSSWTCDSPYCVGCPSCEIVVDDEIVGAKRRGLSPTGRRMVEEAEALEGPSVLVEERA